MDYRSFITAISDEGASLAVAARRAGLHAPVPACDGWAVADLVSHQGRLHRWVQGIVDAGGPAPAEHWSKLTAPGADAILDWYDEGVELLAATFERVPAGAPAWSWTDDHRAALWARRMAHETAIHRWDAQDAAGSPLPFDAALAVDGVQEVFDLLPFRRGSERVRGHGETIHLHATDADGEWLVRLEPDRVLVTNEHVKADVAARGSASDLFLFLWGRAAPDLLEVFGERALLERWQELARF